MNLQQKRRSRARHPSRYAVTLMDTHGESPSSFAQVLSVKDHVTNCTSSLFFSLSGLNNSQTFFCSFLTYAYDLIHTLQELKSFFFVREENEKSLALAKSDAMPRPKLTFFFVSVPATSKNWTYFVLPVQLVSAWVYISNPYPPTDRHVSGSRMGWSWLRRATRSTTRRGR